MPEEPPVREIHVEIHQALRAMTEKLVAVGWEAVGNLSKIAANSEAFKITLAPTYPRTKPGAVAVIAMFALFGVATHSAWATGDTYTRIAETAKVGAAGVVPACQGRLFESLSESGNVHGGEDSLSLICATSQATAAWVLESATGCYDPPTRKNPNVQKPALSHSLLCAPTGTMISIRPTVWNIE